MIEKTATFEDYGEALMFMRSLDGADIDTVDGVNGRPIHVVSWLVSEDEDDGE